MSQAIERAPQKEVPTMRRGPLAPLFSEFPFFMGRMRDEFDKVFESFARQWPIMGEGNGWRWGMDVREVEDAIVVEAEAPGFEAGDFDIQVNDDRLILKAVKKVETKGEKGKPSVYREQECYESVTLPAGINKDKVEAKYHNGVLTVTLPKTPESKGKRVPVKNA